MVTLWEMEPSSCVVMRIDEMQGEIFSRGEIHGHAFRVHGHRRGFVVRFLVDMHAVDDVVHAFVDVDFQVVEFGNGLAFIEKPLRVDGCGFDEQLGNGLLGARCDVYVNPVAKAGKGDADGDGGALRRHRLMPDMRMEVSSLSEARRPYTRRTAVRNPTEWRTSAKRG